MKYLCGHDAEGEAEGTIKEPCSGCAIRDWQAMQKMRSGVVVSVVAVGGVPPQWVAVGSAGRWTAIEDDPADAILEVP